MKRGGKGIEKEDRERRRCVYREREERKVEQGKRGER